MTCGGRQSDMGVSQNLGSILTSPYLGKLQYKAYNGLYGGIVWEGLYGDNEKKMETTI